jgi:FHA domain
MKLRDVQTSFASWVVRLKKVLDPPLAADAQPLEIREGIVDAIEQRAVPAGRGQRVLAHNQISVTVLAPTHDDRLTLQAVLADLQDAVVNRLREIRCQVPAGFTVVVHYTRRLRPGWAPEQRLAVEYSSREVAMIPDMSRLEPPSLRVTVLRGRAMQTAYTLTESHVQIGRTALPVDSRGRPRKNHVAFVEDGDEYGNSVGRAHASIRFDPARGEYRVFDDGSRNGTRVVRNGKILEIMRRDPTGVTIVSGDEIHLGTAAIRVEIQDRA